MNAAPLTLSQLNRLISESVARTPELRDVWVVAELSQVSGGKGTHWYMDLLEKDANGNNLARIKGMIWQPNVRRVNMKLLEATGVYFQSGIKVMVRGQVSFHPAYGMGFSITDVEPSYTIGDMERIRREILEALQKEGLTDRNRHLPVPLAPQRIAVISSESAAGYGDFVHQITSTPENFVFYPVLFPARLQGDQTARSVIAALDMIEANAGMWDMIVIIRGGGAASDLNGFDNLELARRVALSPLPVIVGIGHERDRTVLDEIACVRCKTPTAVAAWLIDRLRTAWGLADDMVTTITRLATDRLTGDRHRLDNLSSLIPVLANTRLSEAREQLSRTALLLPAIASRATSGGRLRIEQLRSRVEAATHNRIVSETQRLEAIGKSILTAAPVVIGRGEQKLEALCSLVNALDPAATLKRGYSITRINGRALRSTEGLSEGDLIETTLAGGTLLSKIETAGTDNPETVAKE